MCNFFWSAMTKVPNRWKRTRNRNKAVLVRVAQFQRDLVILAGKARWRTRTVMVAGECINSTRKPRARGTDDLQGPSPINLFLYPGQPHKGSWPSKKCQELGTKVSKHVLWRHCIVKPSQFLARSPAGKPTWLHIAWYHKVSSRILVEAPLISHYCILDVHKTSTICLTPNGAAGLK